VPILSNTDEAFASPFQSILVRTRGRKPLVVRKDKGKNIVKAKFRELLDSEEIEMRVVKNPDVKCAIV
jgi:hypothetical protein